MVKAVCPKCGEEGNQNIFVPNKSQPQKKYLRFIHSPDKHCYIGRVRSTEEALGEINRPETVEEYKVVIKEIVAYGNSLLHKRYGHGGPQVRRELESILNKYGLWK